MRHLFIINPNAGKRRATQRLEAQIRALTETGNTGGYMTWNAASSLDKYRYVSGAFE